MEFKFTVIVFRTSEIPSTVGVGGWRAARPMTFEQLGDVVRHARVLLLDSDVICCVVSRAVNVRYTCRFERLGVMRDSTVRVGKIIDGKGAVLEIDLDIDLQYVVLENDLDL